MQPPQFTVETADKLEMVELPCKPWLLSMVLAHSQFMMSFDGIHEKPTQRKINNTLRKILVSEIFLTIQGEGALIGKPTVLCARAAAISFARGATRYTRFCPNLKTNGRR